MIWKLKGGDMLTQIKVIVYAGFCNGTYIENEYHFLLVCPLYRDLRIKYFKAYYCRWPTLNEFDDLMCKTSKTLFLM